MSAQAFPDLTVLNENSPIYTVYTGHLMDDNMDELRDRTQCLVSVALGHRLAICHSQLPLLPNESPKLVHWQNSLEATTSVKTAYAVHIDKATGKGKTVFGSFAALCNSSHVIGCVGYTRIGKSFVNSCLSVSSDNLIHCLENCENETPLVSASPPNEDTVLPACTVFSHVVRDCCRIGRDAALTTNAHVVDFKQAAGLAGLPPVSIQLVSETMAATSYLMHFLEMKNTPLVPGDSFYTLDCGHHNLSINLHRITQNGYLSQTLFKETCGSCFLSQSAYSLIQRALYCETLARLRVENFQSLVLLQVLCEKVAKHIADDNFGQGVSITLDDPLLALLSCTDFHLLSELGLQFSVESNSLTLLPGALYSVLRSFLEYVMPKIYEIIQSQDSARSSAKVLFLVGDVTSSSLFQERIESTCRQFNIRCITSATLSGVSEIPALTSHVVGATYAQVTAPHNQMCDNEAAPMEDDNVCLNQDNAKFAEMGDAHDEPDSDSSDSEDNDIPKGISPNRAKKLHKVRHTTAISSQIDLLNKYINREKMRRAFITKNLGSIQFVITLQHRLGVAYLHAGQTQNSCATLHQAIQYQESLFGKNATLLNDFSVALMCLLNPAAWRVAFSLLFTANNLIQNDSQTCTRKVKAISNNVQVANCLMQYSNLPGNPGYQKLPYPGNCILAIYSLAHVRTYLEHLQFPDSLNQQDIAASFKRGAHYLDLALRFITYYADATGYALINLHKARCFLHNVQYDAGNEAADLQEAIKCLEAANAGLFASHSLLRSSDPIPQQLLDCQNDLQTLLTKKKIPGTSATPTPIIFGASVKLDNLNDVDIDQASRNPGCNVIRGWYDGVKWSVKLATNSVSNPVFREYAITTTKIPVHKHIAYPAAITVDSIPSTWPCQKFVADGPILAIWYPIQGEPLSRIKLPEDLHQRAIFIGKVAFQLLSGTAHLEENGVVHRCITKETVRITESGHVFICDLYCAIICANMTATVQPEDSGWSHNVYYPDEVLQSARQPVGSTINYTKADSYAAGLVIQSLLDDNPSVKPLCTKLLPVVQGLLHKDVTTRVSASAAREALAEFSGPPSEEQLAPQFVLPIHTTSTISASFPRAPCNATKFFIGNKCSAPQQPDNKLKHSMCVP